MIWIYKNFKYFFVGIWLGIIIWDIGLSFNDWELWGLVVPSVVALCFWNDGLGRD